MFGKIRTRSTVSDVLKNIKNSGTPRGVCRPSRARPSYPRQYFQEQKSLRQLCLYTLVNIFFGKKRVIYITALHSQEGYIYYPSQYSQGQKPYVSPSHFRGKIIVLVYFLGTREISKNQVNKGLYGQYLVV